MPSLRPSSRVGGLPLWRQHDRTSAQATRSDQSNPSTTITGRRKLGTLEVSPIGLGCMSMIGVYNPAVDKNQAIAVIRAAYERGVTFFDSPENYGPCISEEIVGRGIAPFKGKVEIASKFGFALEGTRSTGRNSRPENIAGPSRDRCDACTWTRSTCTISRADSNVPVEDGRAR